MNSIWWTCLHLHNLSNMFISSSQQRDLFIRFSWVALGQDSNVFNSEPSWQLGCFLMYSIGQVQQRGPLWIDKISYSAMYLLLVLLLLTGWLNELGWLNVCPNEAKTLAGGLGKVTGKAAGGRRLILSAILRPDLSWTSMKAGLSSQLQVSQASLKNGV